MTEAERVKAILGASRAARNSDKELFIIYMQKSGMNLSAEQLKIFKELPDMQTLGRIRRKLQENGEFEADPGVNEVRYQKFKQAKYGMVGSKGEEVEKLLESKGYKILPFGQG